MEYVSPLFLIFLPAPAILVSWRGIEMQVVVLNGTLTEAEQDFYIR